MSLVEAAAKAFVSLGIPGIFSIILQTVLLTLLCLFGFVSAVGWLAFHIASGISTPWVAEAVRWGGSLGAAILGWMLFPGIMPVIVSFFDDTITTRIEARDYTLAARGQQPRFWPEFIHDIGFSVKALLLNILCLPLYLVPVVNLGIFYVLNGYLLGKEFFIMVARRHLPAAEAENLRRKHAFTLFSGGVLFTFFATVPLVNLIAPFWGVALAVHLFHQVYDRKALSDYPPPGRPYGF